MQLQNQMIEIQLFFYRLQIFLSLASLRKSKVISCPGGDRRCLWISETLCIVKIPNVFQMEEKNLGVVGTTSKLSAKLDVSLEAIRL